MITCVVSPPLSLSWTATAPSQVVDAMQGHFGDGHVGPARLYWLVVPVTVQSLVGPASAGAPAATTAAAASVGYVTSAQPHRALLGADGTPALSLPSSAQSGVPSGVFSRVGSGRIVPADSRVTAGDSVR